MGESDKTLKAALNKHCHGVLLYRIIYSDPVELQQQKYCHLKVNSLITHEIKNEYNVPLPICVWLCRCLSLAEDVAVWLDGCD